MKKYLVLLLLPALSLLQYCSSTKKTAAATKVVVLNFEDNVKPLVTTSCAPCHTMGNKSHIGEYAIAVKQIDDIIKRVSLNPGDHDFMPMKHDKLADSSIAVFVKWKADGLLEKAK